LTETGVEARTVLNELLPKASEIHLKTLRKAKEHVNSDIKFFAVSELIRRGELTAEEANELLQDKDSSVKAAAYRFLIERGTEFDPDKLVSDLPDDSFSRQSSRKIIVRPSPWFDRNEILRAFFSRYDFERLLKLTDWKDAVDRAAYRALAVEHFPRFAERLRADLRDEFAGAAEAYYQEELAYWEKNLRKEDDDSRGDEAGSRYLDLLGGGLWSAAFKPSRPERPKATPESMARSHAEYIKTELITAALVGLAEHGEESDIVFGRQYLYREDYELRLEAVRIVSRFGDQSDVPDLIKIAKSSHGILQEFAARGAVHLSGFDPDVVRDLIETRDEVLVSVAVSELIGNDDRDAASALLEPYLKDESAGVRTKTLAFFISRFTHEELEHLLSRYISEGMYYYDVVCGLDGVLYAPASVAEYVRSEAVGELQRCMWTGQGVE
jgi:HEAT repeat protein